MLQLNQFSLSLLKGADGWLALNHMAHCLRVYHLASAWSFLGHPCLKKHIILNFLTCFLSRKAMCILKIIFVEAKIEKILPTQISDSTSFHTFKGWRLLSHSILFFTRVGTLRAKQQPEQCWAPISTMEKWK